MTQPPPWSSPHTEAFLAPDAYEGLSLRQAVQRLHPGWELVAESGFVMGPRWFLLTNADRWIGLVASLGEVALNENTLAFVPWAYMDNGARHRLLTEAVTDAFRADSALEFLSLLGASLAPGREFSLKRGLVHTEMPAAVIDYVHDRYPAQERDTVVLVVSMGGANDVGQFIHAYRAARTAGAAFPPRLYFRDRPGESEFEVIVQCAPGGDERSWVEGMPMSVRDLDEMRTFFTNYAGGTTGWQVLALPDREPVSNHV